MTITNHTHLTSTEPWRGQSLRRKKKKIKDNIHLRDEPHVIILRDEVDLDITFTISSSGSKPWH